MADDGLTRKVWTDLVSGISWASIYCGAGWTTGREGALLRVAIQHMVDYGV